jgi:hypothetical protein
MTLYNSDTYRKLEDETSKVFSCLRPICQLKSIRLLIIMASLFSLSYAIIFTQPNNNYAFALSNNNTNNSKNTGLVQSSANSNLTIPVMTKISNNGTYLIQLKWSNPTSLQSPNIPVNKGFDMEVLFLNASAPSPNTKTVPQRETNVSGEGGHTVGFNQPEILQSLMPVDSYDISIYDNKGHVLWNKTNEMPRAGSGFERITFTKQYKGDITIQINNIKSSAAAAAKGSIIDSVKFATKVS